MTSFILLDALLTLRCEAAVLVKDEPVLAALLSPLGQFLACGEVGATLFDCALAYRASDVIDGDITHGVAGKQSKEGDGV